MKIITIDREYGAGGHSVGQAVADALGIELYDKDIIKQAALTSGMDAAQLEKEEERLTGGDSFINAIIPVSFDVKHVVFENEARAILDLAAKGPCVIIGRCACAVLKDAGIEALHVFLHASTEAKISRVAELLNTDDEDRIVAAMRKRDKQRKAYYEYYTDRHWGDVHEYDLCLDTGRLGNEFCVKLICEAAE